MAAKGPGVTNPGDWSDGVQQIPLLTWGPLGRSLWWAESPCWTQRGAVEKVRRAEHKHLGDWKAAQTSMCGTWSADFLVNVSQIETPKTPQVATCGQLSPSRHRQWCQQVTQPLRTQFSSINVGIQPSFTQDIEAYDVQEPWGTGTRCCVGCERPSKMMTDVHTETTE